MTNRRLLIIAAVCFCAGMAGRLAHRYAVAHVVVGAPAPIAAPQAADASAPDDNDDALVCSSDDEPVVCDDSGIDAEAP